MSVDQEDKIMTSTKILSALAALSLTIAAPAALAAGGGGHVEDIDFSFEGPFGSFDRDQLQRGFQVYTEICSGCHGLRYVSFRDLRDLGYTDAEVRAYASEFEYPDDGLDAVEGDVREGLPTDKFPTVTSFNAPDLSLMAKARAGFHGPYGSGINQLLKGMGGPEFIYSILTGYEDAPECGAEFDTGSYNVTFEPGAYPEECIDENKHRVTGGSWIGMPQPLYGDDVVYVDGTEATLEQEAKDVAAFLMWTAEPKLEARKSAGLTAVLFLILLTVLLYLTNKKLWAPHKHRKAESDES